MQFNGRHQGFAIARSRDDLGFDVLNEEPKAAKREVRITFRAANGPAPIRGSAELYLNRRGADGAITNAERVEVPLDGSSLRVDAFAPGIISGNGDGALGFWFDSVRIDVPVGDEPLEATIDVLPAGAITGRVLDHQGRPVTGRQVNVGCKMPLPPQPGKPSAHFLGITRVNEEGEFFLSPVLLDARTVDGSPIELRLMKGLEISGVVTDRSGAPIAGVNVEARPVDREPDDPRAYSAEGRTDVEGQFRFSNLPDRPMRLFARPIQKASQTEVRPGPPGRAPDVTIRGEVPDWHRSRP